MSHIQETIHRWSIVSFVYQYFSSYTWPKKHQSLKNTDFNKEVSPIRSKFQSKLDKYSWIFLLDPMVESSVCFTVIATIITSNPNPHVFFHFFCFLYNYKHTVKQGIVNVYRQKFISLKHKGNNKIGF